MATVTITSKPTGTASSMQPLSMPNDYPSYGCNHFELIMTRDADLTQRTLKSYNTILDIVYGGNQIVTRTHKGPGQGESRGFVVVTPTSLCLQCQAGTAIADVAGHHSFKKHAFCAKKRKFDALSRSNEVDSYSAANSSHPPCVAQGIRGLYNMGSTCFMSVIIQSLINNPFIRSYYMGDGHVTDEDHDNSCMSCALVDIFTEFYTNDTVDGFGAVEFLAKSWQCDSSLAGDNQQDAHEYFIFLLNQLHLNEKHLSNEGNSCQCIIHRTFYGKLQSDVTCSKCHKTNTKEELMIDLSLDLRAQVKRQKSDARSPDGGNKISLESCLQSFTSPEQLQASQYTCGNCDNKEQHAIKQLSIKTLPRILCIQLKRFEASSTASTKININVPFPLTLDMFQYTTHAIQQKLETSQKRAKASTYDLFCVIEHRGDINGGHYVAYVKKDTQWFLFDDAKVTLESEAKVLAVHAYLLFYNAQKCISGLLH
ncbi:MAG: hypothetical protein M1824_004221 [Vezdaea acicularis]|nr:MAG: hypothetical protein M1824_004221 [Vezdaea acicularis]